MASVANFLQFETHLSSKLAVSGSRTYSSKSFFYLLRSSSFSITDSSNPFLSLSLFLCSLFIGKMKLNLTPSEKLKTRSFSLFLDYRTAAHTYNTLLQLTSRRKLRVQGAGKNKVSTAVACRFSDELMKRPPLNVFRFTKTWGGGCVLEQLFLLVVFGSPSLRMA